MPQFVLTKKAENDLLEIGYYTDENFFAIFYSLSLLEAFIISFKCASYRRSASGTKPHTSDHLPSCHLR